jgi:mono/diheme cytochrome c family protein
MTPRRYAIAAAWLVAAAAGLTACGGSKGINLDPEDRGNPKMERGAQLFAERCAGCHTLDAVGSEGSSFTIDDRERVDGPNFNVRKERAAQVLYAIRNGGYSGAIMPQNLVTGREAQDVADFLAKYAGRDAKAPKTPGSRVQPAGGRQREVPEAEDDPQAEQPILGP